MTSNAYIFFYNILGELKDQVSTKKTFTFFQF